MFGLCENIISLKIRLHWIFSHVVVDKMNLDYCDFIAGCVGGWWCVYIIRNCIILLLITEIIGW